MMRYDFDLKDAPTLRSALDTIAEALDDEGLALLRHNGASQPTGVITEGVFRVLIPASMIVPKGGGHDDYDHLRESADRG